MLLAAFLEAHLGLPLLADLLVRRPQSALHQGHEKRPRWCCFRSVLRMLEPVNRLGSQTERISPNVIDERSGLAPTCRTMAWQPRWRLQCQWTKGVYGGIVWKAWFVGSDFFRAAPRTLG